MITERGSGASHWSLNWVIYRHRDGRAVSEQVHVSDTVRESDAQLAWLSPVAIAKAGPLPSSEIGAGPDLPTGYS